MAYIVAAYIAMAYIVMAYLVVWWGRHHWFERWAQEHRACRERVALIDMSFMSKFLVQGPDAGRVLSRLSTNDVDGDADTITYTQWLNKAGKMEADLTVCKMGDAEQGDSLFMVVAERRFF